MRRLVFQIFVILSLIPGISLALTSTPIKTDQATVQLVAGGYNNDGSLNLGLHYQLKKDWHIYWREAGDTGYPPKFDWTGSENVTSEKVMWPVPERSRYKITDDYYTESYEYSKEVLLPIKAVPVDMNKEMKLRLHVNYAICSDTCIPADAEFIIQVPAGYSSDEDSKLIEKFSKLVPRENGTGGVRISEVQLGQRDSGKEYLEVVANSVYGGLEGSDIFVEGGVDFSFNNPTSTISSDGNAAVYNIPITYLTNNKALDKGAFVITLAAGEKSVQIEVKGSELGTVSSAEPEQKASYSFAIILLFAFLGGLILNVMPCVLPVLSIKILGIIKYGGGSRAKVATSFIVTAAGIITSFLVLGGFLAFLRQAGVKVGWGFNFQEPLFIISLVVILTFFAANMWGLFEINMPVGIGGKAYKKSEHHSLLGHFLTGVLATILATPCTAPFLGTAVGFALTREPSDILLTFAVMGLGMSVPYLVFSMFPKAFTKLPKPGPWMLVVKNFMGVLLAAAAVWLIWVLSNQLGKVAAWALAIICIIKLLKLWAANHIELLAKKPVRVALLSLMVVLAFVLPSRLADKKHAEIIYEQDGVWEEFRRTDIPKLVDLGNVVFVDVTADWCLTCKVNKYMVLDNYGMLDFFKKNNVIAMQADWTNKNEFIEDYLASNRRVGIPFNIVYGPGAPKGIVLSELLTKEAVEKAIEKAKK